jgi:HEXXH motif-containing protein
MSRAGGAAPHRLSGRELNALAQGKLTAQIASKLSAAESSKHRLLVESVRRRVAEVGPPSDRQILDTAIRVLSEVEAHSPAVVARFLKLPQIGSWAVTCLRRMTKGWDGRDTSEDQAPLGNDLGYLVAVAAAAALQSGHRADLQVPLHDGSLILPSLGHADLAPGDRWGIAHLRITDNVATATLGNHTVTLPMSDDLNTHPIGTTWKPIPRLQTEAEGVVIDLGLDAFDPFLASLGQPAREPSADEVTEWQQRLSEAWQILVEYSRGSAVAFAAVVSTLVPLSGTSIIDSRSATSGWAFGAIGLSFPRTSVSLAEIFVHELQHIILGAVEDIYPLVADESLEPLGYAPWRDDPRPLLGMLHGCYAYLGLTAFWRQQRLLGGQPERVRNQAEFARWRIATLDAAKRVATSPDLTAVGRLVVTGISNQLTRWQGDPVIADAERLAGEARTEHWARWRINHMHTPDSAATELASAWLSGAPVVQYRPEMKSVPENGSEAVGPDLGYFMEMRYQDPERLDQLMRKGISTDPLAEFAQRLNEADIALLHNDYSAAVREYTRLLRASGDSSAWIGFAVALQYLGPPASAWVLAERPELVATVYSRIRATYRESPEPIELTEWLAQCLMPLRSPSGPMLR